MSSELKDSTLYSRTAYSRSAITGALAVVAVGAPLCLAPLFSSRSIFDSYNDDFFYYLQVARNFVVLGFSTFNGIHMTNGYHPLWMLLLALFYKLAPGRSFFYLLQLFTLSMGVATYALARRTLLYFTPDAVVASIFAAMLGSLTFLFRTGMEATVAIPALFLLLCFRLHPGFEFGGRQAALYGLLGSVVVLARIDAALFILLLLLADLVTWGVRRVAAQLPWMALGATPLWIYLASNVLIFHTLLPVSGMAKELRFHHSFSTYMLHYVAVGHPEKLILFYCGGLAEFLLVIWLLVPSPQLRSLKPVLGAIAIFPLLYLLIQMFLSEWPLFLWYLYPLPLVFFGAMLVVSVRISQSSTIRRAVAVVAAVVFVFIGTSYTLHAVLRGPWPMQNLAITDQDLSSFAATHPGTYAIGDRAGLLGYLISNPIIQLEGLVMNKEFLDNIRNQSELHSVLRKYKVRYYIASLYGEQPSSDGCYTVAEPGIPGNDSKKMRGTFCTPIATFLRYGRVILVFDLAPPAGLKTLSQR